jgi:hypothetical protein
LIGRRGGVPWEVFISVMVKFAFVYHICLPRLFTSAVRRRKKWPLSGPPAGRNNSRRSPSPAVQCKSGRKRQLVIKS